MMQKIDCASDSDAGLTMRGARRALSCARDSSNTRLGAPILSISDRLLGLIDRVIGAGMNTRVYASTEKLAMQTLVATTAKFHTASSAVGDTRAKTRARYQRLQSSLARLPSELKTIYMAKNEQMMALSRESRAALNIQFERYNEQVSSSKTLTFLSTKLKTLLIFVRVLSTTTEVPRHIPTVHPKESALAIIASKVNAAPPRTFTSFSAVTPTTMMTAVAGDMACISPAMLDSLRRGLESNNAATSTSNVDYKTHPASVDEEVPIAQAFNAEGRGGLWVPSPAKVLLVRECLSLCVHDTLTISNAMHLHQRLYTHTHIHTTKL